jgi:hypothetical protein
VTWRNVWQERVTTYQPDLAVVMIGGWETYDLVTDAGEVLPFGSDAWDRNFRRAIAEAIGIAGGSDRPVALSLLPCYRLVTVVQRHETAESDRRTRHINDLLRSAAATYSDGRVFTVDPPEEFCTEPIATDPAYRSDGLHYEKPGSTLYFEKILPQILDAGTRATPTPTAG